MSAPSVHSESKILSVAGKSIEAAMHMVEAARGTILLLHEALGSVSYWKDFPQKLARETRSNVLLYSRPGHGNSEGPLEERDNRHYLRQVEVVIPALLEHFHVESPIVYGHSEGAGIAILYAATSGDVKALILESPYVLPKQDTGRVIERMAAEYPGSRLQQKLAAYHREADAVFHAWASWAATLDEDSFRLRDFLANVSCPVLILQGQNDEFGTAPQLEAIKASIPHLEHESFANTGHLPHRETTDLLLSRVARFLAGTHRFANKQSRDFLEEKR